MPYSLTEKCGLEVVTPVPRDPNTVLRTAKIESQLSLE